MKKNKKPTESEATRYRQAAAQALAEARRFHDEEIELRQAGKLTEAREKELGAFYSRAFAEYRRSADLAGAFRSTVEQRSSSADDEDAEEDEAGSDDIEVRHPRGSARNADEDGDSGPAGETEVRAARTISGRGNVGARMVGVRAALVAAQQAMDRRSTEVERRALAALMRTGNIRHLDAVERRALSPYTDPEGGWALTHEISSEVIRQIRESVHIMAAARVIQTNAASISFPTFYYKSSGLAKHRVHQGYGQRSFKDILGRTTLTPQAFGDIVSVPEELLEDASYPILEHIAEEIAVDCGEQEERHFLTGTGKGEPLGILDSGVPIAGHDASSTFTADDIKGFPLKLSVARRRNGAWMFSRGALEKISKFRDDSGASAGTGNYLFKEGLEEKDGPRIGGFPVMESEFFPDGTAAAAAAGTPIALFGDWFRGYWIVMRLGLSVKPLAETATSAGQREFKYRKRYDASPVRLDVFAKLVKPA